MSLTIEEKEKQITGDAPGRPTRPDDMDIISPEPLVFRLGDREYKIFPLPLSKQRLLIKLSRLKNEQAQEEATLDLIISVVGELIGEKDLPFLDQNLTRTRITELFLLLTEAENRSLQGLINQSKKKQDKPEVSAG